VNQELVEVIELVITNEIVPKPCGRDKKRSIEDTSEDERIFKRDTLVVETTMREIGEISFTGFPRERFSGWRTDFGGYEIVVRDSLPVKCCPERVDICCGFVGW